MAHGRERHEVEEAAEGDLGRAAPQPQPGCQEQHHGSDAAQRADVAEASRQRDRLGVVVADQRPAGQHQPKVLQLQRRDGREIRRRRAAPPVEQPPVAVAVDERALHKEHKRERAAQRQGHQWRPVATQHLERTPVAQEPEPEDRRHHDRVLLAQQREEQRPQRGEPPEPSAPRRHTCECERRQAPATDQNVPTPRHVRHAVGLHRVQRPDRGDHEPRHPRPPIRAPEPTCVCKQTRRKQPCDNRKEPVSHDVAEVIRPQVVAEQQPIDAVREVPHGPIRAVVRRQERQRAHQPVPATEARVAHHEPVVVEDRAPAQRVSPRHAHGEQERAIGKDGIAW